VTIIADDPIHDALDACDLDLVREDGVLAIWRAVRPGASTAILIAGAASDAVAHLAAQCLNNEFALRDRLDGRWARKPSALSRRAGGMVLVYPDEHTDTLEAHTASGVDLDAFFALAVEMAALLEAAHGAGVFHRGLTPASFLTQPDGSCRLADFGRAATAESADRTPPPALAPPYMSPEHTGRTGLPLDARSDLYSLGVILFQLLTGRMPFKVEHPDAAAGWVHAHLASEPAPAHQLRPGVPPMVSLVVAKLLAKDPRERYQGAAALAADLRRCRLAWTADKTVPGFPLAQEERAAVLAFPPGLYGREQALSELGAAYARVRAERSFGVSVVQGPSGIGKSSLLAQFLADPQLRDTIVISARADQYGGGAPYAALVEGLRRLVSGILAQREAAVAYWRGRIAAELCDAELTLALVPELRLLLGGAVPAPVPSAIDGSGRVAAAVLCLLRAFATAERPLVLLVDNAHWLDAAAVLLLDQVVGMAADLPVMLVIGTRSETAVPPGGSGELITRLSARAAYFHAIELKALPLPVLERLLADTFGAEPCHLACLASLVHHKTAGHPYFVRQFLRSIVDDGLAHHVGGSWHFALEQIRARSFTDNMVALALQRLDRLPAQLQPVLGAIACLGQPGNIELPCALLGIGAEELAELLAPALQAEIVVRDAAAYVFTHDRLQEAAYGRLDPDQRRGLHYALGRLLARQAARDGRDDTLFRAVGHLAHASALIEAGQAAEVAELAARAGRRARQACAYESAAAYIEQALQLLSKAPHAGDTARLGFELEYELACCRFLTGQLDTCAGLVARLLSAPLHRLARGQVQSLAVDLEVRRGQYRAAAVSALEALRAFGIDIPADPDDDACDRAYATLRERLAGEQGKLLHNLPVLDDPDIAVVFKLLSSLLVPASFTSPRLLFLQLCHTLELTLRHGMTADSAVSLAWLGVMVCERYRAFSDGMGYALAARALVERHGYVSHEARVLLALDQLSVWTKPLEFSLDCAQAGFDAARAQGDFTMACFEACHRTCLFLARGDNLEAVRDQIDHALSFVSQVGFADVEAILRTQQSFVDHLRAVQQPGSDRAALLKSVEHRGVDGIEPMSTLRFWRWLYIAILDYLEGDIERALASLDEAGRLAWSAPAHIHQLEFHLFSVLALCRRTAARDERMRHRGRIACHIDQIEAWAGSNHAGFADKLALARGALHEFDGDDLAALDCFERAAAHADMHGFAHIAGLAHECAALLSRRRHYATAATAHAQAACRAYRRWGALDKVARLERAFPEAAAPGGPSGLSLPVETAAIRDIDSVIRSARALSEEIHALPLVRTLMKIALEHANAQRGLLIRMEGDGIVIQAGAWLGADGIDVDMGPFTLDAQDLPLTMLYTAMRKRVPVSVSDSQRPVPFVSDPYLVSYPRCAAIVIPMMKRSQLVGMLYLENRLSSYGFTVEHTQVLSLLAAQAAVSLETAQLYADLLEENRERRRVEKALRESRATLLLGERINQSGSWTWEVERGVVNCSAEFCRIFDLDPSALQVEFETLMRHIHPGDRENVVRVLGEAVAAQRPVRFEHRITGSDGRIRHLFVVGQPMEEYGADVYVGTVSDITRRKADEEALRKAQAELAHSARMTTVGQLTAAIAHEVNQPLMSISSNAGAGLRWLRRDPPRLDQVANLLQEIVGQSQRAGKIIQTLQTLGHRSPQLGAIDLDALIRDILALAQGDFDRHDVVLELDLQASHGRLEGDAAQLQQVLVNLVTNAVDAMAVTEGRERRLCLATHCGDGRVEVRVEDNGIGADEPGLEAMFEPFVSNKPNGIGMGLAVCRSIIEAHGGSIQAQARQPHGCSVIFTLPEQAGAMASGPFSFGGRS
jgi:PAS domain S-box-containing protein